MWLRLFLLLWGIDMNWDLTGLRVKGKYMGDFPCIGIVESSRVKYGGGIQYTVVLDEPIQLPWRKELTDRILMDQVNVVRVMSGN